MRTLLLLPLALWAVAPASGQSPPARTSVYVELLGNGGLYSLNVDRVLADRFFGRAGVAAWDLRSRADDAPRADGHALTTLPLLVGVLLGEGAGRAEVGAGVLMGRRRFTSFHGPENDREAGFASLTAVVGYRYQRPSGGVIYRAGLTPFLSLTDRSTAYPDSGLLLSVGASVGYAF